MKPAATLITPTSPSNSTVSSNNTTMVTGTSKITSSVSRRKSTSNATTPGRVTDLSMMMRNSSQSIMSTTRMANATTSGTGITIPSSGESNFSMIILFSPGRTQPVPSSASDSSERSSRSLTTTDAGSRLTVTKPSNTGGKSSTILSPPSDTSRSGITLAHLQGEVILLTMLWRHSARSLHCKQPCQLTLPPIPLNEPATFYYPYITRSVCTKLGDVVYQYNSTISVSPVTIEALELKPLSVVSIFGGLLSTTAAAEPRYPLGSCSMALPGGDDCKGSPYPPTNNNGRCGFTDEGPRGCPDMQCCGRSGIW
jgi:hypothetical protein